MEKNYKRDFESNLNLLNKKLENLENSCSDINNDIDRNESLKNTEIHDVNQSYNNSFYSKKNSNINKSMYLQGQDKYINNLLSEMDRLKYLNNKLENENKIASHRSQKIQKELIDKINLINDIKINLSEKIDENYKLKERLNNLDNDFKFKLKDINKEVIKLKTQYELSLIEINTLENDKNLLIKKNNELKDRVILLESENRDTNEEINQIKLVKCEIEKEYELFKRDNLKIDHKLRDLDLENKNLKHDFNLLLNERDSLIKKFDVLNMNKEELKISKDSNLYFDHDITIKQEKEIVNKENYIDLINKFNNLEHQLKDFKSKIIE